jgi:hypothetical protein
MVSDRIPRFHALALKHKDCFQAIFLELNKFWSLDCVYCNLRPFYCLAKSQEMHSVNIIALSPPLRLIADVNLNV